MSDDATPGNVPLSDLLGPLPEARWKWAGYGPRPYEDAYSADQIRDYAAAEVAKELDRCARVCEDHERSVWKRYADEGRRSQHDEGRSDGAGECARLIRQTRDCGEAGHDEGMCGNAACLRA